MLDSRVMEKLRLGFITRVQYMVYQCMVEKKIVMEQEQKKPKLQKVIRLRGRKGVVHR